MSLDKASITPEVMNNTLKREIYPEVGVISQPKIGKVRSVYDIGYGSLIMISSDNLSTHDVVHKRQVYAKGENLDAISSNYFEKTRGVIDNHFIKTVAPNTWLVKKTSPILVEMVFRKYLTGSGWKEYAEKNGPENGCDFCGVQLRPGYRKNEVLDEIIFTPTGKGQVKDFPIPEFNGLNPEGDDPKLTVRIIRENYKAFGLRKPEDLDCIMDASFRLYNKINSNLESKGYLLADTKWEFGYLSSGIIILIDECVTPDSSRIWNKARYVFNPEKKEFTVVQDDKQHFRDYVERLGLDKDKKALAAHWMDDDVMKEGIIKYCNIREAITGTLPEVTIKPKKDIILAALDDEGCLR